MKISDYINEYKLGLTIREIACKYHTSYDAVRKELKNNVIWRRKYISDFTNEQIEKVINMFDGGCSVKQIAQTFEISAPSISRLLAFNNRVPICSAKKYNRLRNISISSKQKQIIIGHLLGDGCIYRDGPNSMYKIEISQKEGHEQYFHWKINMFSPFVNNWRRNYDKRGNSVMLHATTICHQEIKEFADMFYLANREKIVPKKIDIFMTPLALAIWIMDDGSLNAGVNMRIATMQFSHESHIELQNLLERCFNVKSKIMKFKYKDKIYNQLTLNKKNTQILSDIISPYVIDCMMYKIMPKQVGKDGA